MPEKILSRAIQGFAGLLGIPGQQTAPLTVDLELPTQTVVDIGQVARYGAGARSTVSADGWQLPSLTMAMLTGIGFYNTSWPIRTQLGARADENVWVYNLTVEIVASAALADWNVSQIHLIAPEAVRIGGARSAIPLFVATTLDGYSALAGFARPQAAYQQPFPLPVCVPNGAQLFVNTHLDAAAGTVTAHAIAWARVLPAGVPPLP